MENMIELETELKELGVTVAQPPEMYFRAEMQMLNQI